MSFGFAPLVRSKVAAVVALSLVALYAGGRWSAAWTQCPHGGYVNRASDAGGFCGRQHILRAFDVHRLHSLCSVAVGAKFIYARVMNQHIGPSYRLFQALTARDVATNKRGVLIGDPTSGSAFGIPNQHLQLPTAFPYTADQGLTDETGPTCEEDLHPFAPPLIGSRLKSALVAGSSQDDRSDFRWWHLTSIYLSPFDFRS